LTEQNGEDTRKKTQKEVKEVEVRLKPPFFFRNFAINIFFSLRENKKASWHAKTQDPS
jgi:hypothetical protein